MIFIYLANELPPYNEAEPFLLSLTTGKGFKKREFKKREFKERELMMEILVDFDQSTNEISSRKS